LALRRLWSRTETGAPSCREMYAATKEHSSDRKLKKATDANYVRHRESSIKTITRENSGRVPENKRDDLLGRHFARTQRVLARPSPPASARANRLVRFPSRDFGTVTPYRSPSYTPRRSRSVSRRAPIQSPVPAVSDPSPGPMNRPRQIETPPASIRMASFR